MPCEACGASGEPAVRRARPFSPVWEELRDAYFACPGCGVLLARISGPAARRPSDVLIDRLPDPEGLAREAFLPELQRGLVNWILSEEEREALVDHLISGAQRVAGTLGLAESKGLRLPGRETLVPSLVLTGLGNPWLIAFCELPGAPDLPPPETVGEVLDLETVEAVIRLTVTESDNQARVTMSMTFSDGSAPVLIEGEPTSFRRRRRTDR